MAKLCNSRIIKGAARRCASRDSTNQNALFGGVIFALKIAIFRGVSSEIFALFQACVGNFDTIPSWRLL